MNDLNAVRQQTFHTLIRLAQPLYAARFSSPLPVPGYLNRLELKEEFIQHYRRFSWAAEQYQRAIEQLSWWHKLRHRSALRYEERAIAGHQRYIHLLSRQMDGLPYRSKTTLLEETPQ